jgi:formylglycine-generating enzyme required for sulfatase activity/predicted MPP superfamily phosphohydrolase
MSADQPIRILHLSDFHFKASKNWDAGPVLRELARFIKREVQTGLAPDLVAITGDLAHAGVGEEYTLARDWLENQLWPTMGNIPRDRLLLVPGNHDVDRKEVDFVAEAVQGRLLQKGLDLSRSQAQIAEVLDKPAQREVVLKRHAAYLAFVEGWFGGRQALPWWQKVIEIRGTLLHIAGLDSAWMACGDDDRGRLLLGRYQLTQTVETVEADGAHWRIALVHHPWDYLAEFDSHAARALVHQHCDLLLRGHLHRPAPERVVPPDPSRACLELPTGCVYETSQYPNAFQWIELSPEGKRVRVHFRAWLHNAWTIDRNQPGCPEGWAQFDLRAQPATPKGKRDEPPPADFRKYLQDLWEETALIDIRGLFTGKPEAKRFPIEDLYIELSASGGAAAEERKPRNRPQRGDALLKAALHNPRLVIIGDPGCGKTTFLRWVAHCLAGDRAGRTPGAAGQHLDLDRARLPVLVPIADWLDFVARTEAQKDGPKLAKGAEWLVEYLGTRATDANQGLAAADFRRALKEGDCCLLLDGLDEAPDDQQRKRARGLIETLGQAYKDCPLVVTSRPAAYQDKAVLAGFTHTHIEALDAAAIDGFLARWSRALFPESEMRAERHREELAAALASRPEIRRMARNTVMLTALAVVHWNEKRLPEQRAELYESILKWLIEARDQRPGREKSQRCRQLLADLALAMQTDPGGRQVQVTRRWAAERLAPHFASDADATARAEAFLAEEEIDSGIIVRRGHQLRFWHLTFQEYLAAQALAGWEDAKRTGLLLDAAGQQTPAVYRPEWRETVLLLAGVLCVQGQAKVDGLVAGVLDRLGDTPTRAEQARAAGLLGAVVQDLSPFGYHPADPRYAALLEAAMAVFDAKQAAKIPLQDRIAAADALARAGDPRLGWVRPDRFVALPGGTFAMGAQKTDPKAPGHDSEADDDEAPVHTVVVDPFQIGRFPVTVAEYAEFVDDEDATDPRWWQAGGGDKGAMPENWEDEQQGHPSRPVVRVTWYQARAFCAWLSDRLARPHGAKGEIRLPAGCVVRLPTEAEWEFAARGPEGRRYPWGKQPPDAGRANYSDTKVGEPSPVGIFPSGTTPEGVADMAGNVYEWCLDAYDEGFYARCAAQGTVSNPVAAGDTRVPRVLRGGSFNNSSRNLRASNRVRIEPEYWFWYYGFRCVLAPPRQP